MIAAEVEVIRRSEDGYGATREVEVVFATRPGERPHIVVTARMPGSVDHWPLGTVRKLTLEPTVA